MALTREACADVVYRAALALDQHDWAGFLALCAPGFRYQIGAFSPEIRRDMNWLDHDRAGLQNLLETLPRHNSDHAALSRHLTVYTTELAADHGDTVSALQVFRTELDGGATLLFAVGKVYDRLQQVGDQVLLVSRRIRVDTRLLGIGSHIPF
jgi:methanesulfonate monooxygenase small subunit